MLDKQTELENRIRKLEEINSYSIDGCLIQMLVFMILGVFLWYSYRTFEIEQKVNDNTNRLQTKESE